MFIEIEGLRFHYEVFGEGPDVLVLHGWGCSIKTVMPIVNLLSPAFRVTALDLPGCGGSDEPRSPLCTGDYARLLMEFIRLCEIVKPVLIGHSNGGRVSIYLNAVSGLDVKKNILIDAAGLKSKPTARKTVRKYAFKTISGVLRCPLWKSRTEKLLTLARKSFGSSDYNSATPVMRQTMGKLLSEDLTPLLPKITAPTLLIWGENDTATPISDALTMEQLIPGSGLVSFKGAGHYSYLERPVEFAAVLNSFLKEDGKH